ncbi:MAG: hypothetical protein AABZ80_06080 [Gemmatimonadota bacterium]
MSLSVPLFLAQLTAVSQLSPPVLAFPETGRDQAAAYEGYQTRFYRDAARNTVQVYTEARTGRVVHLLANADNESVAFTVRTSGGGSLALAWEDPAASVHENAGFRTLSYSLVARAPHVHLGWFLLGSMRVERDFQYWRKDRAPFGAAPFFLEETQRLVSALERLQPEERQRHLALLRAPSLQRLRARLLPRVTIQHGPTWTARITQFSLDGADSLALEIRVDSRTVAAERVGDSLSLRARSGDAVAFTVRVSSSARALTPLLREEIFSSEFLEFLRTQRDSVPLLERQVRGVELLASREKLMAGLPAYATYFGRDMLVSALMMRPIWRSDVSEFVIASVLRKLSPDGQVSHEEALGGQAVREAAAEYSSLVDASLGQARAGDRARAASILDSARAVLRGHRQVRENYHMIDDEFQFPVLVARWLGDPEVPATRKRAFLRDTSDGGGPRLTGLLRELALVARMTQAYATDQTATNLVSFAPRDSGRWSSASWRDSGAGYANGRFAMDVNAIWVPHALESIGTILGALPGLGFPTDSLNRAVAALGAGTPLGQYARDPRRLREAADVWWQASRHFLIRLDSAEVGRRVHARLAALPQPVRDYWQALVRRTAADRDSLSFLALALDAEGRPIGVANSDPATGLFLGGRPGAEPALIQKSVLRDVRLFLRPYPVGLFIEGVGPVVANDTYSAPPVWSAFERDQYHGPRVAWGREVNLFLLGVASQITATQDSATTRELRDALQGVLAASEASGFQSELWSYQVRDGRVTALRYGTGSDVQLWSTTDLAVHFALRRLPRSPQ